MKKIGKDKLPELWESLSRNFTLYLPLEEDGVVNFAPWEEGAKVNLKTLNTSLPPKNLFFPQTENYLRFRVEGKSLQLEPLGVEEERFVIFGTRPCDVAGIAVLDKVFYEEPCDQLYKERREKGIIISLGCNEPAETCFCTSFELEPAYSPQADVALWEIKGSFLWKPLSAKGEELTAALGSLLEDAGAEEEKAVEELREEVALREAFAVRERGLEVEGIKEILQVMFDDPFWDKLFRRCLGCGICTYLCPTCHCFDVQDYSRGQEGLRFRCWDSCMFAEFTLMASGENPRPTQKERVRQRFMHKLLYYSSNFGFYACVGCGRCVRKCPVNLDIAQVIQEVGGVKSGT